jgi:hypothetical protein
MGKEVPKLSTKRLLPTLKTIPGSLASSLWKNYSRRQQTRAGQQGGGF